MALRPASEHGVRDAVEILVFLISQLPHWLLFGCKNSQNIEKRPGDLEKGRSGSAAGPDRRFHEPGPMGCRAVALPNSVSLIRWDRASRRRTAVLTVGRGRGHRRQPHVFFEMTSLSTRSWAVKPARVNFSLVLLRAFSADWPPQWRRGRGHDDTRTRPYPDPPANRAGGSHPDKRDQNSPPASPPLAPLLHPRHARKEDGPRRHRLSRITNRRALEARRSPRRKRSPQSAGSAEPAT